jgi:hypothetical protein
MTPSDGMTFEWVNAPTWSSLTAGTHTVSYKITSDNGCFVESTTDVIVEEPITITLNNQETICAGASVKLNPTISGDLAVDPYSWNDGSSEVGTDETLNVSPCENTTYTLTVRGKACPEKTSQVAVTVEKPQMTGIWPADILNQDKCYADGDFSAIKSAKEIEALYAGTCSGVTVTFSDDEKTDNCGWYKERTYVVTDACQHDVSPANPVITVSGADKSAPVYVSEKIWPDDIKNVNECYSVALADRLSDDATIAGLYSDCGGVTVTHEDDAKDGCEWSIVRTYTIKDACGNTVTPSPTQTISGGDKSAPTLSGTLTPLETTG